jgi:hypothetical protein
LELAGVCAAVGAAVGVVCGASEAGALAAGAGLELEDCCAEHGSVADNRTAQIKMEKVESFTMLLPVFDKKSGRAAKPTGISRARRLLLIRLHLCKPQCDRVA